MSAPAPHDLVDRVDDNDHVVGTIPRGKVLAERAGFRVVHVLVINSSGQLLLQQVAKRGRRSPGRWGSSVAGYLHAGETPKHGAQRRMAEEIGLSTPLHFCGRAKMADEGSTKFIYVYLTRAESAEVVDTSHIEALRFWSPESVEATLKESPHEFTETFPYVITVAGSHIAH